MELFDPVSQDGKMGEPFEKKIARRSSRSEHHRSGHFVGDAFRHEASFLNEEKERASGQIQQS